VAGVDRGFVSLAHRFHERQPEFRILQGQIHVLDPEVDGETQGMLPLLDEVDLGKRVRAWPKGVNWIVLTRVSWGRPRALHTAVAQKPSLAKTSKMAKHSGKGRTLERGGLER
jgi:hypothetical protein